MTAYIIVLAWIALPTNEVVIIWVGMSIYVYKRNFLQLLNVNDPNPCNHFVPIQMDNGEIEHTIAKQSKHKIFLNNHFTQGYANITY
jgi:hypothetical protein